MAYMPQFSRVQRRRKNLNLTSLIDVVFLLVLFFMLTSKFMVSEMLDMSLTTLEGGGEVSSSAAVVITLTGDGNFALAGQAYPLAELQTRVHQALESAGTEDIVLVSHKGVTVQQVVTVMDEIKQSGGRNISMAEEAS